MAIAKLSIDLEARLGQFETELKRIGSVAEGLSGKLTSAFKGVGLAAVGLAGVGSFAVLKGKIDSAIDSMAGLKDAAERTGASVEKLGALKSVAGIGGRDFADIESAIDKMNKALHATDDESKGAGKALAAMGLDIQKLRDMDPADAMLEIAKAQEKFADGSGKSAAMMAIFSKSGAQLIPFLKDLAEQQSLVGRVTKEQAEAADEYQKNIKRLDAAWSYLSKTIAGAVVGPMNDIVGVMVKAQKEGGTLNAVLMGLGATFAKLAGVDISPEGFADRRAAALFQQLAEARKQYEDTKAAAERSIVGGVREQAAAQLPALEAQIATLERRLKAATAKRKQLAEDAINADKPKDTSLNSQTFGAERKEKTKAAASDATDGDRIIKTLNEMIAVKQADLQTTEKLSDADREVAKVMADIRDGSIKTTEAERQAIAAKLEKLIAVDRELRVHQEYQKALEDQTKAMERHRQAMEDEIKTAERNAEFYGLTESQISAIEQARLADAIAIAKENGASADQITYLEEELDRRGKLTDALIKLDSKRMESAEKQGDQMDEFAKSAARNMQSALADFLFDPFAKGADNMVKQFGQAIQRMIAEAVAADLARRLFGGLVQGGKGDGLMGDFLGWIGGLFKSANGNAFGGSGPVHAFASGGAFGSGEVLTRPTFFRFASGGAFRSGVAGEAGPEAALPLKRLANGKLGVYTGGGGGGHTIIVNVASGTASEVRRAAAAGAREAVSALNAARRYS